MRRRFRHSDAGMHALSTNRAHAFALENAVRIFEPNAAYTLIPKNGCSTLRLSIALANGCIEDPSRVNWIHSNNRAFPLTTESAFLADYTFVVLRCPFERLYSAFMDKIVNMDVESWELFNRTQRRFFPHDLTFRRFLTLIEETPRPTLNIHWRPQVDFLLYRDYDDYFTLEDFATAESVLERKIGLTLVDSRAWLKHDISAVPKVKGVVDAADIPAIELLMMKREGTLPDADSVYDDDAFGRVASLYADDVALYREHAAETPMIAAAA